MPQTMKTVLVGCGGMARTWVEIALRTDTIELVGLVDVNRDAAVAMAERYQLPASCVFNTLAEAVSATDADAVFDVTIPTAHAGVTTEALSLGCHVLGEKPMSDGLDAARAMVAAANAAGKTYAVTQTRRPLVGFKSVQQFLADDGLGPLAELHSDFYLGCHFGGFRDAMAHPLLLDMAIHTFDNARQLLAATSGGADPVSVYCHSWNPKHSWTAGHASAVAVFEMAGGVVYTYRGSWVNEGRHTTWEADWRIVGEHGTLTWDGGDAMHAQTVVPGQTEGFNRALQDAEVPRVTMEYAGHEYLIRQFADHVLSDGAVAVECPCGDNIKSLAMVLAAVRSAEAQEKIAVEW